MSFWSIFKASAKPILCQHVYCYRSLNCTKCNRRYQGKGEPIYTPHFMVDGKLVAEEQGKR